VDLPTTDNKSNNNNNDNNDIPDSWVDESQQLPAAFHQHVRIKQAVAQQQPDPVFNELLDLDNRNNSKRASWDFYNMIKCGTGCNPLVYKGYGCYCGFLGSGDTVDAIDMCCKMHDWCYTTTNCQTLEYNLPYFVPYKWSCNGGAPYCIAGKTKANGPGSCSHQLCECDREFVQCLAEYPCPHKKAMCQSPWRYWQNLFMGLGTGMPMDDSHYADLHHNRPRKPVSQQQHLP